MSTNEIIQNIYNHPAIKKLIDNIQPEHIRDDLRQETFLTLLSMPTEKIMQIWASNGLVGLTIKIITNMAFSNTSPFYKKYRKNESKKAIEYYKSLVKMPELNINLANIANQLLENKYQKNELQAHEAILFKKYVEVRSCKKVAIFYNIPEKHVKDVIRKTKIELKNLCLDNKNK